MNPLKVKATGSPITSANISGLQTMTDAEVKNYIANVITEKFAAVTDGTGTAEINITTNNSGAGTSIGTFVDTTRNESIGTHPATGATSSTTYYVKQVTASATENITNRPLAWDSRLEEMTDGDIDSTMDLCINAMVAESSYTAGQYKLQATAPSGGTWVARYTLTDTAQGGNTVTYLWQKTVASSAPTVDYTPLKLFNGGNCKQMTEAEIEQMLPVFRNRIIETGIGTYKIQTDAPSGGTWIQTGNAFTDTREEVTPQNYAGTYTGTFAGNYTGNFIGPVTYSAPYSESGNYSSNFTGNYQSPVNYTGNYAGVVPGSPTPTNFTGFYSGNYAGPSVPYTGPTYSAPPSPAPSYTGYFTGYYSGGTTFYNGIYSGSRNYAGTYAGAPVNYLGPSGDNFAGFFTGTASYTGTYASGVEPGTFQYYTGYYEGLVPGGSVNYMGSYQGAPEIQYYTGYYQGPDLAPFEPGDTFIGEYTSGVPVPAYYTGFYSSYTAPTLQNFTGGYLGPASAGGFYEGYYSGPASYVGYFSGVTNSSGPTYYSGSRNYTGNYEGPGYSGPVFYSGTYAGFFSGPSTPGSNYTGFFTGVTNYSGSYTGSYAGVIPGSPTPGPNYTGFYTGIATYTGYYTGFFSGVGTAYTGFYTGTTNYTGTYSGSYINNFIGTYSGATIQASKETVSSVKLWIRTA